MKITDDELEKLIHNIQRNVIGRKQDLRLFFEEKLSILDKPYKLKHSDIVNIHSNACVNASKINPNRRFQGNPLRDYNGYLQTLAFTEAVLMWLRSHNMLSYIIDTSGDDDAKA